MVVDRRGSRNGGLSVTGYGSSTPLEKPRVAGHPAKPKTTVRRVLDLPNACVYTEAVGEPATNLVMSGRGHLW